MADNKMPTAVAEWLQRHPSARDFLETYPNKPWWQSKRTWTAVATALAGLGTVVNLVAGGNQVLTAVAAGATVVAGVIRALLGKQDASNKVQFPKIVTPVTDWVQGQEQKLWRA